MIDLFTPLGRPPLDTFSPTQEVRTADVLPSGIWEFEVGAAVDGGSANPDVYFPAPFDIAPLGIRTGVISNVELDIGVPSEGRHLVSAVYGLIPGMIAFDAGWTPDPLSGTNLLELGSALQLETPWGTPRVSPRLSWVSAPLVEANVARTWIPKIDFGYDLPFDRKVTAGADLDLDVTAPARSDFAIGLRVRLIDNLGGALYASYQPQGGAIRGGLVLADRFYGQ